jgi:hypothetical protein
VSEPRITLRYKRKYSYLYAQLFYFTLKTSYNPSKVTPASLREFRRITDPLADNVITSIVQSGQEKQINQILMMLVRNSSFQKGMFSSLGPELSDLLDRYIEATGKLPEWSDPKLIAKGEKLFTLYGPNIFMLLNVSSLPMCYCCGNGARVLYDTGRLLAHNNNVDPLARRLMETAQMIVNVLSPGGLSENGSGIVTIQKVRLIHASIRYFLKHGQAGSPWDLAKLGEPINQEDLAGTLMSFGAVIIAGLKRLGANLDSDDTTAWMHCWNITGCLLGIDDSLLPDTYEQGFQLASDILRDQAEPSEAGKALTMSCIKFMNKMIPGNVFDSVPEFLMGYFLQDFANSSGKDLASCIGVSEQEDLRDKLVLELTHVVSKGISRAESNDRLVARIIGSFNKLLMQGMIYHYNGGKGVQFTIPPSLQANWGMTETWKDFKSTPSLFGNRLAWQKKSEEIPNNQSL